MVDKHRLYLSYLYRGIDGKLHVEWIPHEYTPRSPSDPPVFSPEELKELEEMRKDLFKVVGIPEVK
jgi:hypothetical protein